MATLPVYLTILVRQLQDNANALSDADRLSALTQAKSEYSRFRPALKVHELTGDGTTTTFAVPSDWQEDWSHITQIENPAGDDPASLLDATQYGLTRELSGTDTLLKLRFVTAPASGNTVAVLYTTLQDERTIPDMHVEAVASLGASIASQWLANRYAQQTDTTLTVDLVDRDSRSRQFGSRAKELRGLFESIVPIKRSRGRALVRA